MLLQLQYLGAPRRPFTDLDIWRVLIWLIHLSNAEGGLGSERNYLLSLQLTHCHYCPPPILLHTAPAEPSWWSLFLQKPPLRAHPSIGSIVILWKHCSGLFAAESLLHQPYISRNARLQFWNYCYSSPCSHWNMVLCRGGRKI